MTLNTYPRKSADGTTVWACCESSIGPVCGHRVYYGSLFTGDDSIMGPRNDPPDLGESVSYR